MSCTLFKRMTAMHWRILFVKPYQVEFLRLGCTHSQFIGAGGGVVCNGGYDVLLRDFLLISCILLILACCLLL